MAAKKSPSKPEFVTRADLAGRAGVSRSAITKACKGRLADACAGPRIDLRHPAVLEYLDGKGVPLPDPPKAKSKKKRTSRKHPDGLDDPRLDSPDESVQDELERLEPYASMTLREIAERFPTRRAFADRQQQVKRAEEIRRLRLENDETEGNLISREFVKTHVFGALEGLHQRLLRDLPKTAARRLQASVKSGDALEEQERILRDLIGRQLTPARAEATRKLRNA